MSADTTLVLGALTLILEPFARQFGRFDSVNLVLDNMEDDQEFVYVLEQFLPQFQGVSLSVNKRGYNIGASEVIVCVSSCHVVGSKSTWLIPEATMVNNSILRLDSNIFKFVIDDDGNMSISEVYGFKRTLTMTNLVGTFRADTRSTSTVLFVLYILY